MSETASFQYKCRLCGEIESNPHTSPDNAQAVLVCTVLGLPQPKHLIGSSVTMISTHAGCPMGYGVTDLIGYVIKEN